MSEKLKIKKEYFNEPRGPGPGPFLSPMSGGIAGKYMVQGELWGTK